MAYVRRGSCELAGGRETPTLLFRVSDTEPGIAAHDVKHILPLYRVEDSHSRQTGGTALARALVWLSRTVFRRRMVKVWQRRTFPLVKRSSLERPRALSDSSGCFWRRQVSQESGGVYPLEHPSFPATPQSPEQTIWSQSVLRFVIIGIAAGLVIGAMTAVGQNVLSGNLFQLTNSGAIWVIITFVMGRYASSQTTAIVAGMLALVGELVGYYVTVWLISPYVSPLWRILAWCAVAVIAGPLLAWGGYVSRHISGRARFVGLAMLGAIFIGEGLYLIAWVTTPVIPFIWLVIGVGATALLTRREIQRARAWAYTAGLSIFFYGAFETLTLLNTLRQTLSAG